MKVSIKKLGTSIFILWFLSMAVLQFVARREDWPFSRFGMYSNYQSGKAKTSFQVEFHVLKNEQWRPVRYYDLDWIHRYLRDSDVFSMRKNAKELSLESVEKVVEREALFTLKRERATSVRVKILAVGWKSIKSENLFEPDRIRLLVDKVYNAP